LFIVKRTFLAFYVISNVFYTLLYDTAFYVLYTHKICIGYIAFSISKPSMQVLEACKHALFITYIYDKRS